MPVLVSDVVVPRVFSEYTLVRTTEKSPMVASGVVTVEALLSNFLAGGGTTFDIPYWLPLPQTASNVSTDTVADDATVNKIAAGKEIGARLSRNQVWGAAGLAASLAGSDPLGAVQEQLSTYWAIELQKAIISMVRGISKDNGTNDSGDYAHDIAGSSFTDNTTNF